MENTAVKPGEEGVCAVLRMDVRSSAYAFLSEKQVAQRFPVALTVWQKNKDRIRQRIGDKRLKKIKNLPSSL